VAGRRLGPARRTAAAFALLLACIAALALHPVLYPGAPAAALLLGAAAVLPGAWMAWSVQREWRDELGALRDLARRMAGGDLTVATGACAAPEFAELHGALQQLGSRMSRLVAQVRSGTAAVAATSGMLKADNAALSSRTEVQASSLEETASSTEELTSTVRQNADSAQHASDVVAAATAAAGEGARAVANVVQSMDEIRDRSRRIADIIGVIDGIAFQTNILALNAAVEAARAGDEGRGFAVVAGEVRSLAQRSASAAQEIRALILGSVEQVETGSERVQTAGQAMEQILANVRQASALVAEIAAASEEQSSGIEEINRAVVHIDGMTQQNAGLVEDVTRTVTALQEEAEDLSDAAADFVLGVGEFGNATEATALVQQGVAFLRSHGREALVAEVNKLKKGRFVDRDLYLSVWAEGGTVVGHGVNRRLWNVDWTDMKDSDGRRFVAEIMQLATQRGQGWMDYKWVHPVSKRILVKTAYFEKCGDTVVSCGFYKQQDAAPPRSAPARPRVAA
jgi:methyl-accepting chemotaxis protein